MSNCLKRNANFLNFLNNSKDKKQINALLNTISRDQVKALSEICNHLLCGHCKMDKNDRVTLRNNVKSLKKIASPKASFKAKKKIINQNGGNAFKDILPVALKSILKAKDFIVKNKELIGTIAGILL